MRTDWCFSAGRQPFPGVCEVSRSAPLTRLPGTWRVHAGLSPPSGSQKRGLVTGPWRVSPAGVGGMPGALPGVHLRCVCYLFAGESAAPAGRIG